MSEEEQIILPDGYTKLEWISADGASYLQLPITTAAGDKVVLETNCRFYSLDNQADGKNGNPYFFFGINNGVWYCGAGNYGNSSTIADTDWHRIKLIHSSSDCGLYIDDVKINSRTYNSTSAVLNGNICVFRTYNGSYYSKNCKKDWKLYVNDELVYNLIPCLDNDSVPCMFDLVSKQTFYKQGTGNLSTDKTFLENYPYPTANYNLPADFKKCVYLQSDGTQWINTQVVPDSETGLYFRALQLSYGNFIPLGLEENGYAIYPPRYSNKDLYYKWGNASTKIMTWDKADDLIFSSYLNFYNSKITKFNSSDTDAYSQITSQTGTFTIPIWLFSYNSNGSFNTTYGKWGGRIYRAQITQGDTLIRDFVPCLDDDNRPCMFDLITQEAFYNQSGGTEFSYCVEHKLPSDFIKLKYLESDGTQFIKTGYVPTNTTGLYIDAYNTVGGDFVPMGCRNDTGNTRFFIGRVTKTNASGYGWGSWVSPGGTGDCRYDATLNWLNDRKSIINAPAFAQRVNSLSTLSFTPLYGINLFGVNQNDSNAIIWKGRIYRAKISEGSEVVRDFVPAYDQRVNKPCMYDLINNVAYYNDGTGEFLYNRDFEGTYKGYTGLGCIGNKLGGDYDPINEKIPSGYKRVEFLESTGEQLIYIPYEGNGYTGLYIKGRLGRDVEIHPVSTRPFVVVDGSYSVTQNKISLVSPTWSDRTNWIYGWGKYDGQFSTDVISGASHDIVECSINWNTFKDAKLKNCITGKEDYKSTHSDAWVWGPDPDNDLNYPFNDLSLFGSCNKDLSNITYCKFAIYNAKIRQNHEGCTMNLIPVIDDKGKPAMFDSVSKQTFYEVTSNNTFIIGLKTLSHAIQLLLPDSGGSIQLSLPTNDNTEYYEAKIRANNPNWEIIFYYH